MDVTNAVRIRCAQLGPPAQQPPTSGGAGASKEDGQKDGASTSQDTGSGSQIKEDPITALESAATTRKHDPVDVLHTGPRSDGLVPVCDEFDICGSCFCEGKEVGRHKRWHDYRVVVSL